MTVANECPDCGTNTPLDDATSEQYEQESGDILYLCEDIFCGNCGAEVGGYAHPQV